MPSPRARVWTTSLHAFLFLALLGLAACRDPKVTAYRAPKDAPSPAAKSPHGNMAAPGGASAPAGMGGTGMPATGDLQVATGHSLTWTAPAGWESRQGSTMRKATFAVLGADGASADLAITAFPGDVGGDAANVNRWRGQLGLAPVSEADALAAIERFEANGLKVGVVDLVDRTAQNPVHMLGGIVPFEGATWFFKLTGPDAVVAPAKPAFLAFMRSVKPAAAAPAPATP
ncbi:hypothetical protein [Opitutus sp. ER46]|uniref:hypothetical protein n=1 Tax=Opitutus sp. ER46 TaxID=2161864 RepID=UPI001E35E034|nr:hypothetical protein [Opitutus sp. ER46]